MNSEELTMSTYKAQLCGGLFFFAGSPLLGYPFYAVWRASFKALAHPEHYLLAIIFGVMLIGVVSHELIHGYTAIWYGGIRRQDAKFGVQWKTVTPYFHSTVPLSVQKYRWVVVMPLLLLGLLPYVVALLTGNIWLAAFGIFFILAASGDVMILWLMRHLPPDERVQDHPTKVGLIVITAERTHNPDNAS